MGHPSGLQRCLPFLPTKTCCSPRTPYQMPTLPQSPFQGHAPWAIHTPGGFSKLIGMLLLLSPARNLWWCFGKLLVPAPHEVVSVCCAVAWRERSFWFTCVSGTTHMLFTIRTASVDTGGTATPHVINALSWGSSVVTAAKFGVLSFCWGRNGEKPPCTCTLPDRDPEQYSLH